MLSVASRPVSRLAPRGVRPVSCAVTSGKIAPVTVATEEVGAAGDERTVVQFVTTGCLDGLGLEPALRRDFGAKSGRTHVQYPATGGRRVLVGIGKEVSGEPNSAQLAVAAHHATVLLRQMDVRDPVFVVPATGDAAGLAAAATRITKGALLSAYRFSYKTTPDADAEAEAEAEAPDAAADTAGDSAAAPTPQTPFCLDSVTLALPAGADAAAVREACEAEARVCGAVCLARTLSNERADAATPARFQHEAEHLVETATRAGMTASVRVLDYMALRVHGLDMLASVGQAAKTREALPRLVAVELVTDAAAPRVALVGKGVTFDSGGLNLKPTGSMETMHMDCAGAAAVMGTLSACVSTGLPVNLVAVFALAENAIDSLSYKPGAVLASHAGKTVEVGNTDAEGRLCLADAMSWTQDTYSPEVVVDVATLTGACVVALGEEAAGLFANDDALADALVRSGDRAGETCWRLPVLPGHVAAVRRSKHADLSSTGPGRAGGACTAAAFLQQFVRDGVRWAHLDVAGPAMASKPRHFVPAGGTGFGVQLLVDFLRTHGRDEAAAPLP